MELFLPSLIVVLLSAVFAFLVVPRMGSTILVIVCLLALIAVGIHHYNLFSTEYAASTWQYGLAAYSSWIVLGFALLFILGALYYLFGGEAGKAAVANAIATPMAKIQNAANASVAAMPTAASATNAITAAINRGTNAIVQAVPLAPAASNAAAAPAGAQGQNRLGGIPLSQV